MTDRYSVDSDIDIHIQQQMNELPSSQSWVREETVVAESVGGFSVAGSRVGSVTGQLEQGDSVGLGRTVGRSLSETNIDVGFRAAAANVGRSAPIGGAVVPPAVGQPGPPSPPAKWAPLQTSSKALTREAVERWATPDPRDGRRSLAPSVASSIDLASLPRAHSSASGESIPPSVPFPIPDSLAPGGQTAGQAGHTNRMATAGHTGTAGQMGHTGQTGTAGQMGQNVIVTNQIDLLSDQSKNVSRTAMREYSEVPEGADPVTPVYRSDAGSCRSRQSRSHGSCTPACHHRSSARHTHHAHLSQAAPLIEFEDAGPTVGTAVAHRDSSPEAYRLCSKWVRERARHRSRHRSRRHASRRHRRRHTSSESSSSGSDTERRSHTPRRTVRGNAGSHERRRADDRPVSAACQPESAHRVSGTTSASATDRRAAAATWPPSDSLGFCPVPVARSPARPVTETMALHTVAGQGPAYVPDRRTATVDGLTVGLQQQRFQPVSVVHSLEGPVTAPGVLHDVAGQTAAYESGQRIATGAGPEFGQQQQHYAPVHATMAPERAQRGVFIIGWFTGPFLLRVH